ncbi:MAG: ABC transporter permease [Actinomycetota bacterium]|nr:ABC transporter permease [Actinomycetota bacterium]
MANNDQRAQAQTRLRWELLSGIIRKDLRVKYQGSLLGFVWSLANPLLLLVVYTFVFGVVLKNGVPHFGYYLLAGLLVWNFFAGTVASATGAVVGNAGLVQKVPFPLAVLPLASVGFGMVHLVLQLAVMFVVMLATGYTVILGPWLLLMIPALFVAILLATGVSFLVSALNVRYRDTQHIVEILLMAGFWLNPIVYVFVTISHEIGGTIWAQLYWLNPMAGVTVAMQKALYAADITITGSDQKVLASTDWSFYLERLGIGLVVSFALFSLGLTTYRKMSADFAETL